jgi:hypothetical protein
MRPHGRRGDAAEDAAEQVAEVLVDAEEPADEGQARPSDDEP